MILCKILHEAVKGTYSEKARKYPNGNGRVLRLQLVKEGRRAPRDRRRLRGADGWLLGLVEVWCHRSMLPFPASSLSGSLDRMRGQRPHLKGSDRWGLEPSR